MALPSIKIRPPAPDPPEFIDIDCSGMDTGRTVELLINGVMRASIQVLSIALTELDPANSYLGTWSSPSSALTSSGAGVVTYAIPDSRIKTQVTALKDTTGQIDRDGEIVLNEKDTSGNSIELRYKV